MVLQNLQKEEMACDIFVEFRNSKLRGKVYFSQKKKILAVSGNSQVLSRVMSSNAALNITLNIKNK